jgi:UDP-N-acetylmuramate dehydrogenase
VAYPLPSIVATQSTQTDTRYHKLAAGWLIDQLGWKGFIQGEVGVHEHQALVLVCSGSAKGKDVLDLALRIKADVDAKYGVKLEIEPRLFDNRGEFTYNLD